MFNVFCFICNLVKFNLLGSIALVQCISVMGSVNVSETVA